MTASPAHAPQTHAAAALPLDPNQAAQAMMTRIKNLQGVYERETGALEAAQVEVFMAMQEEKLAALASYQEGMAALLERKDALAAGLTPAVRKQLNAMQQDFTRTTTRNMEALERMQRCVGRVSDKICALARADVMGRAPVGYGANGGQSPGALRTVSTGKGEVV